MNAVFGTGAVCAADGEVATEVVAFAGAMYRPTENSAALPMAAKRFSVDFTTFNLSKVDVMSITVP